MQSSPKGTIPNYPHYQASTKVISIEILLQLLTQSGSMERFLRRRQIIHPPTDEERALPKNNYYYILSTNPNEKLDEDGDYDGEYPAEGESFDYGQEELMSNDNLNDEYMQQGSGETLNPIDNTSATSIGEDQAKGVEMNDAQAGTATSSDVKGSPGGTSESAAQKVTFANKLTQSPPSVQISQGEEKLSMR